MLKVASSQYTMKNHKSFSDFLANAEAWVKEAKENKAELLLYPEYGSIELVSLLEERVQKDLLLQLKEIQKMRDDFLKCYKDLSKKYDVHILAPSFPWELEDGTFINRAFVFSKGNLLGYQDKQMMTRFEDEHWKVSSPKIKELNVFEIEGYKVGISICFDVEFPDFARELALKGIELLMAPSCTETHAGMWRVHVGARARALENQFYVAVSQTIGEVTYSEAIDFNTGMAAIYSTCDKGYPNDGIISQGEVNIPGWIYATLDKDTIKEVRENGNVLNFKKISLLR